MGVRSENTYSIGSSVLLLCAEDGAASLSSIQSTLSSNDGLTLRLAGPADLATNLGDGSPIVRHCGEKRGWTEV